MNWSLDWSLDWARHWTEQALSNAIDMNETSSIKCNRHERNKFYYIRVVDTNQKTTIDLIDWARHSIVSLLQWQFTRFSNEPLTRTFYDLSLFTTLATTAKMICTADRIAYTICLERIEHILYVWKHEDMSWNSFIVEYLKLNRKSLLEWQD